MMSTPNENINNALTAELILLLRNAENNREQRENTRALGIGEPHLVPFVTGIIFSILQDRFTAVFRLTHHRPHTQNDLVSIFLPFWQSQVQHIQTELQRIYRL